MLCKRKCVRVKINTDIVVISFDCRREYLKAVWCCREDFQKSGVNDRQGVIESFKKNPFVGYICLLTVLSIRKNVFGKCEDKWFLM